MQHLLTYPKQPVHPDLFAVFVQFMEWSFAILLTIAVFPALRQIGMYILTQLYEIFIQYQYLF